MPTPEPVVEEEPTPEPEPVVVVAPVQEGPCHEAMDAYENNNDFPGYTLSPMVGDSAARSIATTFHTDSDVDWFHMPVLERTHTGKVRVRWAVTGAVVQGVRVRCNWTGLVSCEGGTLIPDVGASREVGACAAYTATGELVVQCAEGITAQALPAALTIQIGYQRLLGGQAAPNTTCRPEALISYEPVAAIAN